MDGNYNGDILGPIVAPDQGEIRWHRYGMPYNHGSYQAPIVPGGYSQWSTVFTAPAENFALTKILATENRNAWRPALSLREALYWSQPPRNFVPFPLALPQQAWD